MEEAAWYAERLQKLADYEKNIEAEVENIRKNTVCGFFWGEGPCGLCLYRDLCRARDQKAGQLEWKGRTKVYVGHAELERGLRQRIAELEQENGDTEPFRILLADVLRRMARSGTVLSEDRAAMAAEALEIFDSLYYASGDPARRSDAESCRLLLQRLRGREEP